MMFNRRIWKPLLVALAVVMGLAVFTVRVEEWTKGLRSEFIVYGQSTGFAPPAPVAQPAPQGPGDQGADPEDPGPPADLRGGVPGLLQVDREEIEERRGGVAQEGRRRR